jgi:hypothetical protein
LRGFIRTSAGVVEEQQQDMISVPDPCGLVGNSQQHIDLTFVQVADRDMGRSLELHRTKLRRPAKILRAALADEGG